MGGCHDECDPEEAGLEAQAVLADLMALLPEAKEIQVPAEKVVVDADSLAQLDGMVIDFVKTNLLNEGFEFRNPNIKEMCGCGESFSV